MNYNLPTKEECDEICKQTKTFYCIEKIVEGVNVALYDYRLASLSNFIKYDAFELRGLCFVETESGWERNLLMNKFFNINQTNGWMYDDVKDKKIVSVANKEDGSIISFVKFPNGKIRAKSKMSFESGQAQMAQDVYDNDDNLKEFVSNQLNQDKIPVFELVSPNNKIVLHYNNTELVLLQIRNADGTYETNLQDKIKKEIKKGIKLANRFEIDDLDFLLSEKTTNKDDIEGWVVTFEDGQLAKIKTDKYLSIHGLMGMTQRENLLIKTIVDGNIDDLISNMSDGENKDRVKETTKKVENYFNNQVAELIRLCQDFQGKYNKDRKSFFADNKRNTLFSSVLKMVDTEPDEIETVAEKIIKEYIKKTTKTLGRAKEWLKNLD